MNDSAKARLIIGLLKLASRLPLPLLHAMGNVVGRLLYWRNGRERKTTEINLAHCFPDMGPAERHQLLLESLRETGRTALEMGPSWLLPADQALSMISRVEGKELVDEPRAQGKGVVIIAPHLGNWELLGLYLGHHYQCTSLYQPPRYEELDVLIQQSRSRTGAQLVPTNRKGVMALLKHLKQQGVTGILPDQEPELSGGVFAPFFGKPALTMTLLSNLVAKTGAVAVGGIVIRQGDGSHKLIFLPADERIYSSDDIEAATGLNATVEACVHCAPAQYQWEYKRFKRQQHTARKFYQF